jgi:flagellar hook-associated protein 1 FlgK
MGSLFSSLNTASSALDVFSRALGTDQSNVANASTPGYAAQQANIQPIDLSGDGGGNDFISLSSNSSSLADATVQAATSQASLSQTQSQQLSPINQLFDITGSSGILAALQQFSSAFSSLAVTPNDSTLQASALSAAGNVATAFNQVAAGLDTQQSQIDSGIQTTTTQINNLASRIQQLNVKASSETQIDPATDASLRSNLDQLSSLVDITVTRSANGAATVLAGGQLPLVEGDQAYTLTANPSAAPGSQISSSAGGNSPQSFGGSLGALLETRNGAIGQLLGSGSSPGTLNTLASGFASRVNALLASGVTASGASGVPIFSFDTTNPTNAARSLTLNSSVTGDQLALASTGASAQSNGIANSLASLPGSTASADQVGGLSAEAYFGAIAASVGQQLSDAQNASTSDQTSLTTAQTNRQQQIGVSLDQEATNITTFERAYQANAQVVSILDQLSGDTINLISSGGSTL